ACRDGSRRDPQSPPGLPCRRAAGNRHGSDLQGIHGRGDASHRRLVRGAEMSAPNSPSPCPLPLRGRGSAHHSLSLGEGVGRGEGGAPRASSGLGRRAFLKLGVAAATTVLRPTRVFAQGAPPRVVVVGGGFAGTTCARALRQADPRIVVTLVEPTPT